MLAEVARVLLAPFGGRGERELLGVPVREHDRPLRTRALLRERAERSRQLHQRRGPARRIDAAVDPRITMVADDHELIRERGAGDASGDRPDRTHRVVHLHPHADDGRPRADAIRDRQTSLPRGRRLGSLQRVEEHPRVSPRERRAHDLRQRHGVRGVDAPGAGHRRPARGQRIARHAEVVDDAAALDVAFRSPRAVGIGLALLEPIVCRIGVDEEARCAALLGRERLESAIAVRHRVPHEHDLALHVDAVAGQPVVVGRVAAAGIDDRAR